MCERKIIPLIGVSTCPKFLRFWSVNVTLRLDVNSPFSFGMTNNTLYNFVHLTCFFIFQIKVFKLFSVRKMTDMNWCVHLFKISV